MLYLLTWLFPLLMVASCVIVPYIAAHYSAGFCPLWGQWLAAILVALTWSILASFVTLWTMPMLLNLANQPSGGGALTYTIAQGCLSLGVGQAIARTCQFIVRCRSIKGEK